MTPQAAERWQRIKELAADAIALDPEERAQFLATACADNETMRREVEALATAHDQAADAFEPGHTAASVLARAGVPLPVMAPHLAPGRRLAAYDIVETIGIGGMGEVYRARDRRLDRDVAIKVLPPTLVADPYRRARFVQEARAASALEHPHIAVIHEIGESDGLTFIVMELVRGEPLNAIVARGPIAASRAIELAVQIAEALARAHDIGIVHRDLKPANVIVTTDGHAKIIDFGLAKLTDVPEIEHPQAAVVAGELTGTGMVVGTAAYMSPEQAQAAPVDHRSDIFTLGAVLQEMLTGAPPFRRRSGVDTMHAVVRDPAPPLPDSIGEAADDLQRIIDKCLAKAPADRYQTMRGVAADLRIARRRLESSELRALEGPSRFDRWMRIAAAATVAIVLAGASAVWLVARRTQSEADRNATIARVERLRDAARFVDVWRTARSGLQRWPGDVRLEELLRSTSQTVTLRTDPPEADVAFTAYDDLSGNWSAMGRSPVVAMNAPLGLLRLRITKAGFDPLEARFDATVLAANAGGPRVEAKPLRLRPVNGDFAGMVFVPGDGVLTDYWIDRAEVTNRDFEKFVNIRAADLRFRDRTGRPGPATWEFGTYPPGRGAYPVNGVNWFEAVAYCRSVGKTLPTRQHWRRALGAAGLFGELLLIGNFRQRGIEATDQLRDVGPFGTLGMAGNVKEWIWNEVEGRRYILGGAWNEPVYMAVAADARPAEDRSETNGFRCIKETAPSAAAVYAPIDNPNPYRDYPKQKPVDNPTFNIFRRFFSYDRVPLDAKTESTEDASEFRRERVSFAAAYNGERVLANILIPKNTAPPYRTVIWFPGSYALDMARNDHDLFSYYFDFLPRRGYAVVYPVYKGTYERGPGVLQGTSRIRDLIIHWSMDLGRTIDYLETRPEFDNDRIAFYAVSMGAIAVAPVAVEPRLKTAVFLVAGLHPEAPALLLPEVDPINFLPRVKIPSLLLGGQYDFRFPVETSQRPFFERLGTPAADKRHVIFENTGHVPPRGDVMSEVLPWLDKYLGR